MFLVNRFLSARKAHFGSYFARNSLSIILALFFFIFTGVDTNNPTEPVSDFDSKLLLPTLNASLSFSNANEDIFATNSIDNIFSSQVFSGPNRALKQARQKPQEDVLQFTKRFESARLKIAALRNEKNTRKFNPLRLANSENKIRREASNIAIGATDISLMSAALAAINKVDGSTKNTNPAPIAISKRLAYVRANTPATKFITPTTLATSNKQLQCLATAIYFEARGEPYRGQVAVAQVVINRVKHKLYPNTICGVVYQNQRKRNACQFSFACDGIPERINEKKAWKQALDIARKVTNGELYLTEVANATHYHATYVRPKWAKRMTKLTQIGIHKFYRFRKNWPWS